MPDLRCETCDESFWQGRGRPARRCPRCREGTESVRYGPAHRALAAQAVEAVGQACTRCGQPILDGQRVSPDHLDGGGPTEYAGWAHAGCNYSAGASYGNRLRAAVYRAAKAGLPVDEVLAAAAGNGSTPAPPASKEPPRRSRKW